MTGTQHELENQLRQLQTAWENARAEYGEESPECSAALEKYTTVLLEIGGRATESEQTAKFILGQNTLKSNCDRQASSDDGQTESAGEEAVRIGSGTLINEKYRILRWIGQGGMSRVYLVNDVSLNKEMALKIIHSNLRTDKDTLEQFEREAKVGSLLNHPNLVRVHDFGEAANGYRFIVMEYVDGLTLGQLLAKAKYLEPERAVHIFSQVCAALEQAHSQKIIHTDIKPSNILIIQNHGKTDFVKVVDFGFAQLLNDHEVTDEPTTRNADVFGSPHYMSPEQCQGALLDARSDIYSLACVMFEALTGAPPFTGSIEDIVNKHICELPGRINNMALENQKLLNELELIVFRCLAKEPEDRNQSMASLKTDLDNLQQSKRSPSFIEMLCRGFMAKTSKRQNPR